MSGNEENQRGVPPPGKDEPQPETAIVPEPELEPEEKYGYPVDPYQDLDEFGHPIEKVSGVIEPQETSLVPATQTSAPPPPAPPSPPSGGPPATTSTPGAGAEEEEDDDGMLRMSFLEHLEELRSRLLKAIIGLAVAFFGCIYFSNDLWGLISAPATAALKSLNLPPDLVFTTPMEAFSTVWVKVPMLVSIFVGSPWILYQVWAFIAPGLYKRERRWAAPFVICSAGLFILGGLFAYFVAFRFGLTFLLGIGRDINIRPMVTISEYFDLFVNVTLGIGLVFELPILIFFLVLLRIVTPHFLLRNSRYAILIIVALAAVVTPTPDIFNMMLFATPMCLLYYVGIFCGYVVVHHRETGRYPWKVISIVFLTPLVLVGAALAVAILKYGYHFVNHWPYLVP